MTRVTKEKCIEIINEYEPSKDGKKKGQLGIDGRFSTIYVHITYHMKIRRCGMSADEPTVHLTSNDHLSSNDVDLSHDRLPYSLKP